MFGEMPDWAIGGEIVEGKERFVDCIGGGGGGSGGGVQV